MVVHDFSFWSLASVPVLSLLLNVIGHSNYDFFPGVSDTHALAASRRHHLHHARPNGNYGFALADRKSTRLNSSHLVISYAVFCLKKKKTSSDCNRFSHQMPRDKAEHTVMSTLITL